MHHRHNESVATASSESSSTPVAVSFIKDTVKEEVSSNHSTDLLTKFKSQSFNAQAVAAGSLVVALVLTFQLSLFFKSNTDLFTIPNLGAGQLFAFIVCFTSVILYATLEICAYLHNEPLTFKRQVLSEESESQLQATAEFACYMMLFFFCDRTKIIPREKKHYSPDTFWFLWLILVVAGLFTLRKAKQPKQTTKVDENGDLIAHPPPAEVFHVAHLQRDQTEEWKGWMQVMFLWYHYFEAKPIYNVIRLYIAAYVWMTGFGNFSYYYIRKDFSLSRFFQMQWRLNFMVIWVCAILANEYMLYYICMLHTLFTMMIYAGLGILPQLNSTISGVSIKFGALALISFALWDVSPDIFDTVWKPLSFLVQYNDPYNKDRPVMEEWRFRSHLDHLIWIVGMWCAFCHPRFDSWLLKLDAMPAKVSNSVKGAVVAVCLLIGYWYVDAVFLLPKKEYNKMHPYTSFIPILLFIVLRNIFTTARMYHIHLFEFLGKTTLETYIAQFHIWMATTGVNGAPKRLLRILPEGYPLVNFAVVSAIFLFVSYRLFQTTNTIKNAVLPSKGSNAVLQSNVLSLACCLMGVYIVSVLMTFAS